MTTETLPILADEFAGVPALPDEELNLTSKMAAYVDHFVTYRNPVQAYKHAYDTSNMSLQVIRNEAWKLKHHPDVAAAIKYRFERAQWSSSVDVAWILQRFLSIATADPRELIGLKVGACRYCHGFGHAYHWREREFMEALEKAEAEFDLAPPSLKRNIRFPDPGGGLDYNATAAPHPDCPTCHGEGVERFVPRDTDNLSDEALLLYGGVKAKRDGYEIIIADRNKALENVGRILGAFNDKLQIDQTVKSLVAVADLAKMDPQEAARKYQEFIKGESANRPDSRNTGKRAYGSVRGGAA